MSIEYNELFKEADESYRSWKTNAEYIRSMTDEELAQFLGEHMPCHLCAVMECKCDPEDADECRTKILKWLEERY